MTVNLRDADGIEIFKKLVRASDAVIESRGPGTMEKLGIGYEVLKEVKPDIIMVSMPAFGLTGPYKSFRSYGYQLDAFAGMPFLMGYRGTDASSISGTVYADATAGVTAALALLMALHYRTRTGKGLFIELAQVETLIPQFGESIIDWTMNHQLQKKLGNRHPSAVQGCYRCKGEDRWVNITITSDEEWEGFLRALDNPPWSKDRRFSDGLSRYRNHDELDKFIEEWTTQHDHYEVMLILQREGVPAGPVMNERDCFRDPHLREREFFEEIKHVDSGTHLYPGIAWRMSKMPNEIRRPACCLGEHNEYIFKKIIGVSAEEYADLEMTEHIGMDFDITNSK
jgi:crotonobetainyl-CoA:carnitine CoA-transferase CaiB-like acyl-CoA transferase